MVVGMVHCDGQAPAVAVRKGSPLVAFVLSSEFRRYTLDLQSPLSHVKLHCATDFFPMDCTRCTKVSRVP